MKQEILFQRIESVAIFGAVLYFYNSTNYSWLFFIALLFLFDLSMIGYLKNSKLGAYSYNLGHSYISPIALGAISILQSSSTLQAITLIWIAHISMDRSFGYGLKKITRFTSTTLGEIGKK